jgi:hypothetical protein
VIFSRKNSADPKRRQSRVTDVDDLDFDDVDDEPDGGPEFGPYDIADAPKDSIERLDLGALQLPAIGGVEIQLQAGKQGDITGLVLSYGGSQMQLGVFAAPRTEGIWDEIRDMIRENLAQGGSRPEEVEGEYGPQLKARVRDQAGATAIVRHVGIDGPRWFVHAVFYGAEAAEPSESSPLTQVLRGLVVDRGQEGRPVREPLPMRLPPQAQEQLDAANGATSGPDATPTLEVATDTSVPAKSTRVNGSSPAKSKPAARKKA